MLWGENSCWYLRHLLWSHHWHQILTLCWLTLISSHRYCCDSKNIYILCVAREITIKLFYQLNYSELVEGSSQAKGPDENLIYKCVISLFLKLLNQTPFIHSLMSDLDIAIHEDGSHESIIISLNFRSWLGWTFVSRLSIRSLAQ